MTIAMVMELGERARGEQEACPHPPPQLFLFVESNNCSILHSLLTCALQNE